MTQTKHVVKLKTLQDLKNFKNCRGGWREELKQEAIKWVKEYRKCKENRMAIALEHFFNITEEDEQ